MANKKKRCKLCREYVEVEKGVQIPAGFFCSINAAAKWGAIKEKERKDKNKNKEKKVKKEELKTVSNVVAEVCIDAQAYARERDYFLACISCGGVKAEKFGGSYDGGHYRSKGSAPHLRLYTLNIHKQCVHCNRFEGGNSDYRIELVNRLGEEKVTAIETDNRIRHYSKADLRRLQALFRKKTRLYKKRRLAGKR